MSCPRTKQLAAYLEDKLAEHERNELEDHLEDCLPCQRALDSIVLEIYQADAEVEEELRTNPVSRKIIEKLPDYPLGILKKKTMDKAPLQIGWKERGIDIMKRSALAVASIAAVVALGTSVSPTFATYVGGLYGYSVADVGVNTSESIISTIKEMDRGALEAAKNGYVQPLNLSVTDQGITIEIKEVLADPLRIMIAGQVKGKDGKPMKDSVRWNGDFTVKNKTGEALKAFYVQYGEGDAATKEGDPKQESENWYHGSYGDYQVLERELSSFFNDEYPLPDELVVEFNINEIYTFSREAQTEESIKGNWKLEIPVNMKKAKAATKKVEIDQQYTSPGGVKLHVKELKFAPSGTQIITETNIKGGWNRDSFNYQIVDEKGSVVAVADDTGFYNEKENGSHSGWNVIDGLSYVQYNTKDKSTFIDTFDYMSSDQKYTLKLEGINKMEKAAFETPKLALDTLEKNPVTVEKDGAILTFSNAEIEKDERGEDQIAVDIKGTLGTGVVMVQGWGAVGEHGAKRRMDFKGEQNKDANGTIELDGKLYMSTVAYKMENGEPVEVKSDKPIKELTINYAYKREVQPNVSWEVPLQPKN
ncbi:DUF4179 domain-containing protein [Brevibacillus sp. 179-C 1.1 NHS]|uniref:DUF4179 domain-containing protein n=1 Tax=Brevibacillus sp. 179-C 1.1 NHS TaxID=3235177 RepID=UPI0039A2A8BE